MRMVMRMDSVAYPFWISRGPHPFPGDIVHLLETINTSPVDATKIKLWTARDPVLSQVLQFVLQGWPSEVEEEALEP